MTRKQERNIIAFIGTVLFMGLVIVLLFLLQLSITQQVEQYDYIELAPMEEEIEEPKKEIVIPRQEKNLSVPGGGKIGGGKPEQAASKDEVTEHSAEPIMSEEEIIALRAKQVEDSIREERLKARNKALNTIPTFSDDPNPDPDPVDIKTPKKPETGYPRSGTLGGNRWELSSGEVVSLPKPSDQFNQEGKVIVSIRVNADGKVIDAYVDGGDISDKATQNLALEAARKVQCTTGDNDRKGKLEYNFKFR